MPFLFYIIWHQVSYFWSRFWDTYWYNAFIRGLENCEFCFRLQGFLLIGNISFMKDNDRPLLLLHISLVKTCRFCSWIERKPSFSKNLLDDDCSSLYVVPRQFSLRLVIFPLFSQLWYVQVNGHELYIFFIYVLKKELSSKHYFNKFV